MSTTAIAAPASGLRRSHRLLIGLGLFSIAATGVSVLGPVIAAAQGSGGQPSFEVIAATGAALVLLAGAFLAYVGRVLGLSRAWLLLAGVSNACVLVYRFIVVPRAFYGTTFTLGWLFSIDPNQPGTYVALGLAGFVLLALLLGIARLCFGGPLGRRSPVQGDQNGALRRQVRALVAATAVVGGAALALCALPALFLSGSLELNTVIQAAAGPVVLLASLWVISSSGSIAIARWDSSAVRDVTVVTAFLWVALALLLVIHILWVVYMGVLANLLPFKTVTPGK